MAEKQTNIHLFMDIVGGKWKCLILFFLSRKTVRTKEFYQLIPGITQKVLTEQLRQLEHDGLIIRTLYAEVPPRVEYRLTTLGRSFIPVLEAMCTWGKEYARLNDIQNTEKFCISNNIS